MVWIPVSEHFNINTSNTPVQWKFIFISANPKLFSDVFFFELTLHNQTPCDRARSRECWEVS